MDEDTLPELVATGVERTLELARSWLAWDGTPRIGEDPDRIYTPAKALRRHTDHLLDHLAHVEALLAGAPTVPDGWHGSLATFEGDWARVTELELGEAGQRLRRLAQLYRLRLSAAGPREWDRPRAEGWTVRQIVEHVAPPWYAEQVGDLRAVLQAEQ